MKRLARRQIDAGVHFLVPCGTTGETPTLSADERRRVVELVVEEAAGQVPVLAGAGGYDTKEVMHAAARDAEGRRAGLAVGDAVLQQADARRAVSALQGDCRRARRCRSCSTTCPAAPAATSTPATCARLATIPTIVGVKEASGNIQQMAEVCRAVPDGFLVLSGDDALTLPLMAIGGRGIISVASNEIPAEMSQMVEAAERGDFAAARAHAHAAPAAAARQLHRVESRSGEVRDGGDGPVRRGVSGCRWCSPRPASQEKILGILRELGLAGRRRIRARRDPSAG